MFLFCFCLCLDEDKHFADLLPSFQNKRKKGHHTPYENVNLYQVDFIVSLRRSITTLDKHGYTFQGDQITDISIKIRLKILMILLRFLLLFLKFRINMNITWTARFGWTEEKEPLFLVKSTTCSWCSKACITLLLDWFKPWAAAKASGSEFIRFPMMATTLLVTLMWKEKRK